ncbi:MAG: LptE family protein [Balneolaceae bacterium]|nr:LptE family protein [Balneolaceae bacterium]
MKRIALSTHKRSPARLLIIFLLGVSLSISGCFNYGFTGTSIPEGVNSIYLPFFADQSSSGIGNLSDQLNQILIDRFVNQTKLSLANNRGNADAVLEGQIMRYTNQPFSVTSEEEADQNEVTITVQATYEYYQRTTEPMAASRSLVAQAITRTKILLRENGKPHGKRCNR